ncbi:MAG: VCBS repeat-containing protein [Saprospiraceae bacterium]|nr:VCBS repeat-containing protein [Saprospiraceae bacterium]MBK7811220.1 VCBS repeat-containing protein [Saprospiraceae bacterium]MBK9631079.1 VCBS repeat-containing protein [Saprospiraceae bacterium]
MYLFKINPIKLLILSGLIFQLLACDVSKDTTKEMSILLNEIRLRDNRPEHPFVQVGNIAFIDSLLKLNLPKGQFAEIYFRKAIALLAQGEELEAIKHFEKIESMLPDPYSENSIIIMKKLAIANLRMGERQNCITNHTNESCLLPLQGAGIHADQRWSEKSIEILKKILQKEKDDLRSIWLLNIAYMTIGKYPKDVPAEFLVPNLDKDPISNNFKPFEDIAPSLGLNIKSHAGGVITEDFNRDGFIDMFLSDWFLDEKLHYFKNNGDGSFSDLTKSSGISELTGGLNMMQTDFDNDGDMDVFILRGAWMDKFGEQPNSLLKNNGDNTFTDVTFQAGFESMYPTQAAVWNDFNNDGWLDVFIGNETSATGNSYPCQLFINNKNGTFTDQAEKAGCRILDFVKGVTAGDYNNDGLMDLYISSLTGNQLLLKNSGIKSNIPSFINATREAGLDDIKTKTFPTWFWDYNNDGWLDIFVSGYDFGKSLAHTVCQKALGLPGNISQLHLYKNNQNGTFTNVSEFAGLNQPVYSMGANFGDIDNDGYLDMFLATGNPEFEALVPNRLFKNSPEGKFTDVSISAGIANLQKGHGVSICDLDNDGDQDIYVVIGGAFPGDHFRNAMYLNPGQNTNTWVQIQLEGSETNKAAIGSRIKISINENGIKRDIYRDVNSGGSFGSSPLRKDIGLGQANIIDELTITWQKTQKKQIFKNIPVNQLIQIKEGDSNYKSTKIKYTRFVGDSSKIMCKLPSI